MTANQTGATMSHGPNTARAISPYAKPVPLTAKTRQLLSAGVRMGTIDGDTRVAHGPRA